MRLLSNRHIANSLLLGVCLISVQAPALSLARAVPDADPAPPTRDQNTEARAPYAPAGGDGTSQPVPAAELGAVSRVYYGDGHASTLPGGMRTVRSVQLMLMQHPEVLALRIEGHADDVGDPTFNLEMSKRRVRGVARWLIENGVAAERLQLFACGRRYAEAGVRTAAVRAQNRRVELSVSDPPQGVATHDQCDPIELK